MPVYRVPKSGELFYQPSPIAPRSSWTSTPEPSLTFLLRARRKQGAAAHVKKHNAKPRPSPPQRTIGRKRSADHNPAQRAPEVLRFKPARTPLGTQGGASSGAPSAYSSPLPRKSRTGGSVRSIAFYTTNDKTQTPYWRRYAQVMVKQSGGEAFGVSGQGEARKILDGLKDTDISEVFFVGHGFEAKGDLKPSFMFSGIQEDGGFYTHGDPDMVLNSQSYTFMNALVPHLSRDRLVSMTLLCCHAGADTRLQRELAQIVHYSVPEIEISVAGWPTYFMIKETMAQSPRAQFVANKRVKPNPENDVIAPKIPPHPLTYSFDDPLRMIARDSSDDPLSGIEDML